MPRQSKRGLSSKSGCGTSSITNTPGESYSIDSKEVLKQIEDLKKAIGNSKLKEPKQKKKKNEPKPERKSNFKKIPAVKPIINKYNNKEALTEEDYNKLVIYKEMMKKNAKLKKTIDKIDEIINGKFEKKGEQPAKEEIEEIKINEIMKPIEQEEVKPPKRKRGRPRKSDKKGSGVKTNKEVLDEFRRLYKQDQDLAGDGLLSSIYANSLGYWFKYGIDWHKQKKAQQEEIERLKKELEGSGIGENVRDFFLGPIGWIRWAKRAQRDREIEDLKRQIEEKKKKQIQK